MLAGSVLKKASDSSLLSAIESLQSSINRQVDLIPRFTKLLRTNGQIIPISGANDSIIYVGQPIPANHNAKVTDISVNFAVGASGTVRIVVLGPDGKTVLSNISEDINSTASGQAGTVLDEGERVGLQIQTTGAGTIGALISGEIQKL